MVENGFAENVCSLYVNNMHLIVMLIPYIERELEKGRKIVTILAVSYTHLDVYKRQVICKAIF